MIDNVQINLDVTYMTKQMCCHSDNKQNKNFNTQVIHCVNTRKRLIYCQRIVYCDGRFKVIHIQQKNIKSTLAM